MTTATTTTDLTAIAPLMSPEIGTWQILLDGQPYGPTWTFRDVAAGHVQACRKFFPGCWELTNAKTGERIACDELEEAFLAAQSDFEAREAAEGAAPVETPACDYCGGELGDLDTTEDFTYLAVNDDACLPCLRSLAANHEFGQYASA